MSNDAAKARIKQWLIDCCGWTREQTEHSYIMVRKEQTYPRTDAWRPTMSLWEQARYFIGVQLSKDDEVLHIVCVRCCEEGRKLLSNLESGNSNPRLALATVKEQIEKQTGKRKSEWVARMLSESPSLLP